MRGRTRARLKSTLGVAVAAAAVLAMSAAPASADPVQGRYVGHKQGTESKVSLKKGSQTRDLTTSLLRLRVSEGQELLTYCIEINTKVQKVGYTERGWSETTLGNKARKVNWVLHNSYPYLSLDQFAKGAGLSSTPSIPDAVAGTQAAIWHYSDGYDLRLGKNRPAVEAIYKYLTGSANTGMDNEPAPTLSLSPDTVSGAPGDLLGPVEVSTSADKAKVALANAPEGAKLLGPDKKTEVTTAKNGDKLWVSVPKGAADGAAKVTADVVSQVSPGRVFKADVKAQTLILASSEKVSVHDEVAATWTHTPTAVPVSESEQVCKPDAGVKITIGNKGDKDTEFTVTYGDTTETEKVAAGESKWKVIPVKEDTAYKIVVESGDYKKVYKGVLNCAADQPAPTKPGKGGGLPETGLNNLTLFLGVGGGLLLAGLVLMFVFRKRRNQVEA